MITMYVWLLAMYLLVVAIGVIVAVVALWPEASHLAKPETSIRLFRRAAALPREKHLLLLVLAMGAAGGCAWALWWFSHRAATGELADRHFVWYFLRPWTSALVAMVVYALVRSGLLALRRGGGEEINAYIMAGIAGIVGLLANEALSLMTGNLGKLFGIGPPSP